MKSLFLVLLFALASPAGAEEGLDAASMEALQKTQNLLNDREARDKAVAKDAKARDADQRAAQAAGSAENKERMYQLASDLMPGIASETGGDPEKMQKLVESLQRDPASLEQHLTTQQRLEIKRIAEESEKKH
jgi:hypothetical protein